MLKALTIIQLSLIGVIRAQMAITRAKSFTLTSIKPMGRLLTLADDWDDDLLVTL